MAPDVKHRKDPSDPHLKFMTRSRRLISGTRDHMITIDRISAEIHELSRTILADHEEFVRSRSEIFKGNESDDGEVVQDIHIEREVSFEAIHDTGSNRNKHEDLNKPRVRNHLSVPVRYPDVYRRKDKSSKPSKRDGNDALGKQTKVRSTINKLPYVPRVSDRNAQRTLAHVYGVHQIPYVQHKVLPIVKVEPEVVRSGQKVNPPPPRFKLFKLKLEEKPSVRLPVLEQKHINQSRHVTVDRSEEGENAKEIPVVMKRPLPVYKAPVLVMQPPGNAPRTEKRLPPVSILDRNERKEVSIKTIDTSQVRTEEDNGKLPMINGKSATKRPNLRSGRIPRPPNAPLNQVVTAMTPYEGRDRIDLYVNGNTVNGVHAGKVDRVPYICNSSRDNTFKNNVKPRLTVHLPKVKQRCSVSPDFTVGKEYHRPSYLIKSPDSFSHIAPTASMESCGTVSPMPFVHQMTLTHRQTMLISRSPIPKRFLTNSRPGSIMRESPRPESVTKLPKLFITANIC